MRLGHFVPDRSMRAQDQSKHSAPKDYVRSQPLFKSYSSGDARQAASGILDCIGGRMRSCGARLRLSRSETKFRNRPPIYRVGSFQKLFTDIGIMQMVEAGKINLAHP